jgi:hypothetical protein
MNLGNQIVAELGGRGLVGQFFDYAGYKMLRGVENCNDLSRFLRQCDYQSPPRLKTPSEAVDYLVAVNRKMDREETPWFFVALFAGLFTPFAGLFFWSRLLILQLNRRSRKRL